MIEYENLKKVNEKLFDKYKSSFDDFIKSGWYVLGSKVSEFEDEFAKFCGTGYSVGVASGLDALILAIDAFDFPKEKIPTSPNQSHLQNHCQFEFYHLPQTVCGQ
jgi:dTDP-4-amino-4,6-dideoxygalactose transaminase